MINPTILEGYFVTLQKLSFEHLEALAQVAQNPIIWRNLPIEGWQRPIFNKWITKSLQEQENGNALVFVIMEAATNRIIGTTRFQDICHEHRKTDIGWTWFAPEAWGLGFNLEAKNMMLTHAFENWNVLKVGFKVDERNLRSQRALEKIGASREGFIRKHLIRPDSSSRNSYLYGITDEDWFENTKVRLQDEVLGHILKATFANTLHQKMAI